MIRETIDKHTETMAQMLAFIVPEAEGDRLFLREIFLANPQDDKDALVTAKGSRCENTCVWITKSHQYSLWLSAPRQILWISGGPGKGKTMMSIYLAEHLEERTNGSENETVIYFFCDNRDDKRNKAEHILRGWIWQLCRRKPTLQKHGMSEFKSLGEKFLSQNAVETLWRIFLAMICDPDAGTVYCLLDGLDECDDDTINVITEKLSLIFSDRNNQSLRPHRLKLAIISRPFLGHQANAMSRMSSIQGIRLDPDFDIAVGNDLRAFINQRVAELSQEKDYSPRLRDHVKKTFGEKSDGTFLWVGFMAHDLRNKSNSEAFKCLENMPIGLEGIYGRILKQLERLSQTYQETIRAIFHIVALAYTPLTLVEISHLLNIPTSSTKLDEPCLGDYIKSCQHFMIVLDDTVKFVHQSARDYLLHPALREDPFLETFRIETKRGHLTLARICLKHIELAFEKGSWHIETRKQRNEEFAWQAEHVPYAPVYWYDHARDSGDLPTDLILRAFTVVTRGPASARNNFWIDALHSGTSTSRNILDDGATGVDDKDWTPKDVAASMSHTSLDVVGVLLDKCGALVASVKTQNGSNALQTNPNKRDSNGNTPLHEAAEWGMSDTVEALLSAGANPSAQNMNRDTPLHRTMRYPYGAAVKVCQLLVSKGANVNSENKFKMTPLHLAARSVNSNQGCWAVWFLVKNCANINLQDSQGKTPLHWAASFIDSNRVIAVFCLLLENGGNPYVEDIDGMTPLMITTDRRSKYPRLDWDMLDSAVSNFPEEPDSTIGNANV